MITGFNTDVRHRDVVFHVQTEDKGTQNPCVESLVYVGGQILARKRAGYRSLLDKKEPEAAITELMERQHENMIQEIKGGALDEQVESIQARKPKLEKAPPIGSSRVESPAEPKGSTRVEPRPRPRSKPAPPAKTKPKRPAARKDARTSPGVEMPELPRAPEPPTWVPPRKRVAPKPAASKKAAPADGEPDDRSLDQVILDYLEMESDQERLVLTMNPKSGAISVGQDVTLSFTTVSSVDSDPLGEVKVTVRLISTIEEPLVLAEGRTDDSGEVEFEISIPELAAGTGALIVSAESGIGKAEMRHLI